MLFLVEKVYWMSGASGVHLHSVRDHVEEEFLFRRASAWIKSEWFCCSYTFLEYLGWEYLSDFSFFLIE